MTNYTDYTTYFKQLATDYLGHSPEEKHFFRKGLEEFLNGMQTSVNYPALLLDKYDFKYDDNGSDSVRKIRTVAFIICDHNPDGEDYEKTDAIQDSCELIVDKIYNRLRKDIAPPFDQEFLRYAQMSNVQVSPVENYADGNYGYFVTIDIFSLHDTSVL